MNFYPFLFLICFGLFQKAFAVHLFELTQSSFHCRSAGKVYHIFEELPLNYSAFFEWKLVGEKTSVSSQFCFGIKAPQSQFLLKCGNAVLHINLYSSQNPSTLLEPYQEKNQQNTCYPICLQSNSQSIQYSFILEVPPGQWVPPGVYHGNFELHLIAGFNELIETYPIQFTVEVSSSQMISLEKPGSKMHAKNCLLDFGEIDAPVTKDIVLSVASNDDYRLKAVSNNGFQLSLDPLWKHPSYQCTSIPYTCACNTLHFSSCKGNCMIALQKKEEKNIFSHHTLSITIHPDPKKHWEGIYSDEIIFTVESLR